MTANISIPRATKNQFGAWLTNFINVLSAEPEVYEVNAAVIAQLDLVKAAFDDAFAAAGVNNRKAKTPGTYTQPMRAALDTAYNEAIGLASQIARQIQVNNAISDADKLNAGVVPLNDDRTPIPTPATQPVLGLMSSGVGFHQLEFEDSLTPGLKSKPFGVMQVELYGQIHAVGATPNLDEARKIASFTKNPMIVTHNTADNGKEITYWSRYITRRGFEGNFGGSITHTIGF